VDEVGCVVSADANRAPQLRPGAIIIRVDPRYFRPSEVETLLGDPTLAREQLGWTPRITLDEMIAEMVDSDVEISRQSALLRSQGFHIPTSKE
jgi:GDPmannose 4,6-dehydratase